jgi:hypothetical protein
MNSNNLLTIQVPLKSLGVGTRVAGLGLWVSGCGRHGPLFSRVRIPRGVMVNPGVNPHG